jgi:hypothetical protein
MTDEAGSNRGLEPALEDVQTRIEAASRTTAALVLQLRRSRSAAASGQVKDLRRGLAAAAAAADSLRKEIEDALSGYDVDEATLLADGSYVRELLAAAQRAGVSMFAEDERLLCYPSIIRLLPGELALEIDRKRTRGIRPTAVVEALGKAQQAGPRFKPAPFLGSLADGYDLALARSKKLAGSVIRLVDVHAVLTLLPGQAREYGKAEFARDLYLLDLSEQTVTADGRRLRWAASSGTRQAGVLTTVARTGQQQRYWGISFEETT